MANISEVLANNIKDYRRKYGFSQDKLAKLVGISSLYKTIFRRRKRKNKK